MKRNKNAIQMCFYVGYGDKGRATKQAIKDDARAVNKALYRYILDKLGR